MRVPFEVKYDPRCPSRLPPKQIQASLKTPTKPNKDHPSYLSKYKGGADSHALLSRRLCRWLGCVHSRRTSEASSYAQPFSSSPIVENNRPLPLRSWPSAKMFFSCAFADE